MVVFSTTASTEPGYADVTAGNIATVFTAASLGYDPGGFTNWQDALQEAAGFFEPDLIVMITDGEPTAYNSNGGTVVGETPPGPELDNAITAANALKTANAHILMVGVSPAPSLANLMAVSGPDKAPPSAIDSATIQGLDVITSSFENLEEAMPDLAVALCADIDIDKTPDLQILESGETATFTINVTNTGDVPLTEVTVADANAPDCDRGHRHAGGRSVVRAIHVHGGDRHERIHQYRRRVRKVRHGRGHGLGRRRCRDQRHRHRQDGILHLG